MAQAARLNMRLQKELKILLTDPPPGVSLPLLSDNDNLTSSSLLNIDARIEGPEGTVYSNGVFTVKIQIPERYPFQPPNVTFATPIYHPNIDDGGRICLDILNLPPKGAWRPSICIFTVLTSIGLLLREPNPDDGLMAEASSEYKYNRQAFEQKARSWTERYATAGIGGQSNYGVISANQTMAEVMKTEATSENAVDANEGIRKKLRLKVEKSSAESSTSMQLSAMGCGTKSHHESVDRASGESQMIIVSDSEESGDDCVENWRSRFPYSVVGKRKNY